MLAAGSALVPVWRESHLFRYPQPGFVLEAFPFPECPVVGCQWPDPDGWHRAGSNREPCPAVHGLAPGYWGSLLAWPEPQASVAWSLPVWLA